MFHVYDYQDHGNNCQLSGGDLYDDQQPPAGTFLYAYR